MRKLWEEFQLSLGWLSFESTLEADYQRDALPGRRRLMRWSQPAMLLLILAVFALVDSRPTADIVIAAAPAIILSLALFAFSLIGADKKTLDLLGIGLFGALLAIVSSAVVSGIPQALTVYTILTVAVFTLMGLEFRLATACVAICVPTAIVTMLMTDFPSAMVATLLLVVLASTLTFSSFLIERLRRESFLKTRELNFRATRDPATGLANRKALDTFLLRAWRHCSRDRVPLAVARVRIDHFADYLQHYGRDKTDSCVQTMAELVESACRRPLDFVARINVDEFAIVLPGCNTARAVDFADNLRRDVIASVLEHAGSPTSALLTVSIGVASCAPRSQDPQDILREAGAALAAAQAGGHNRVANTDEPGHAAGLANVIRLSDVRHAASQKAR